VRRRRDGQELSDALDDSEDDGFDGRHVVNLSGEHAVDPPLVVAHAQRAVRIDPEGDASIPLTRQRSPSRANGSHAVAIMAGPSARYSS
jgi:hypothetical protein